MNSLTKKISGVLFAMLLCVPLLAAMPMAAYAQDAGGGAAAGGTGGSATTGTTTAPKSSAAVAKATGATTDAPTIGDYIQNFFLGLLSAIQSLILYLLEAAANGVKWMIEFGTTVMTFPVVTAGFEVTLSLVNLLFVMALIIISFEIILDFHAGEAKKTLGKLILAALLINFSLLIAGFLLDVSNIFTNFFMHDINATSLTAAFNPQRFGGPIFGTGFWAAIASSLFSIIMTALILITMSAILVMATVRNVIVAGLLLLMPLTWGLWIFPGMKEHHADWWKNFLKYGVSYLPTLTFFLYLAIATASNVKFADSTKTLVDKGILGGLLGTVIQLILLIGIIVFGLKTAEEAGGVGADLGMNLAKKAGGMAARNTGKALVNARIPGFRGDRSGDKSFRGLGKMTAGWASKTISGNAFLKRIPGSLALANKAAESSHYDHNIEEYAKNNLSHMSYEQLRDFQPPTDIGKAAKLKQLSAMGKTDDFINDPAGGSAAMMTMAGAYQNLTHKHGRDAADVKELREVAELDPRLASIVGRTIAEQVKRTPSDKIAKWDPSVLDNAEVQAALLTSKNAIQAVAKSSDRMREKLENIIIGAPAGATPAAATAHIAAARTRLEVLKDERKVIEDQMRDEKELNDLTPAGIGRKQALQTRRAQNNARVQMVLNSTAVVGGPVKAREMKEYIDQVIDGRTNVP